MIVMLYSLLWYIEGYMCIYIYIYIYIINHYLYRMDVALNIKL